MWRKRSKRYAAGLAIVSVPRIPVVFKDTIEKDIMFGPINLGVNKQEAKVRAKKYLNKLVE